MAAPGCCSPCDSQDTQRVVAKDQSQIDHWTKVRVQRQCRLYGYSIRHKKPNGNAVHTPSDQDHTTRTGLLQSAWKLRPCSSQQPTRTLPAFPVCRCSVTPISPLPRLSPPRSSSHPPPPRGAYPTTPSCSPQRRPVWTKHRTRAKQTWKKMPQPMRAPRSRPT